jgi:hypothetical protein
MGICTWWSGQQCEVGPVQTKPQVIHVGCRPPSSISHYPRDSAFTLIDSFIFIVKDLKDVSIGPRSRSRRVSPSILEQCPSRVLTFHPSVTDLRPNDTAEDPFLYTFKVQCTSCREIHPNWVSVNRFVSHFRPWSLATDERANQTL